MINFIKKHGFSIIFFIFLVLFVYFKTWWGVAGLFIIVSGLQIFRLVLFFKSFPWIKEMILNHVKKWETAQLGYDLDDPYWNNRKRPSIWQKLRGINPNQDISQNKRRRQINKDILKSMSAKDKYFSMFDYKTTSKTIFLIITISVALLLLNMGLNILYVFGLMLVMSFIKKRIDSKLLSKK